MTVRLTSSTASLHFESGSSVCLPVGVRGHATHWAWESWAQWGVLQPAEVGPAAASCVAVLTGVVAAGGMRLGPYT